MLASTKPHQFLWVCISCVKKMLNPLRNVTNAPAANIFRFCSLTKIQSSEHRGNGTVWLHGAFTILLFNIENEAAPAAASPCVIHLNGTTTEERHSLKSSKFKYCYSRLYYSAWHQPCEKLLFVNLPNLAHPQVTSVY